MKQLVSLLFSTVILVSACASPVVATSAPIEQVQSTSTSPSPENTATATTTPIPEPTITSTPVPQTPHWYWSVDPATMQVIAANQFGDRKEIGKLDHADNLHTTSMSLDDERALLFLDDNNILRVYLLTLDGVQKIKLPSEPVYFNTDFSYFSRTVVTVHNDYAVFTYITTDTSQSMTVGAVDTGPVFLVDLKSLTAKLIDTKGNRDPLDANHAWFRTSKDGRYLRYINGNPDVDKMEIREVDLVTGEVRTIYTTEGAPTRLYPSPEGDLWYLRDGNLILDVNGNKTAFTDHAKMASPLKDGEVLVYPWSCVDNCAIKIFAPFGSAETLTYNIPWTIDGATSYVKIRQVLPNQSLLFAVLPYMNYSNIPAIVKTYPDLAKEDIPLFRLTPDGKSRLVGIYVEGDLTSNVSPNSQFFLMQPIDKSSFFIYDAVADRPLFSMPIHTELDAPLANIKFFDNGILVKMSAAVPGTKNSVFRTFYYEYHYQSSTTQVWEDVNLEFDTCIDILDDGTLACWVVGTDGTNNEDLIRFDPANGTRTILLENTRPLDWAH